MGVTFLLKAVNASGAWRRREFNHQLGLRRYNEELDALISRKGAGLSFYVCECSDAECTCPINLSHLEYAEIRGNGAQFAIAVHHEDPETDRLVSEGFRYATIEKLPGPAARMAIATDGRGR